MNKSRAILSIEIDGEWPVRYMWTMLLAIEELYDLQFMLHKIQDNIPYGGWLPSFPLIYPLQISQYQFPEDILLVHRISYASPGIADLAGIGVVVGHIKDFLLAIIEHKATRKKRELDEQEKRVQIEKQRIENAQNFVKLAHSLGVKNEEIRELVGLVDRHQELLIYLIDNEYIRSIKVLEEHDQSHK